MKFVELGQYFKHMRLERGMDMKDVSKHIHIHRETLSKFENGETFIKQLGFFDSLMELYHVDYVMIGEEDDYPELINLQKLSPEARKQIMNIIIYDYKMKYITEEYDL